MPPRFQLPRTPVNRISHALALLLLGSYAGGATAQAAPDAGQLLQQQPKLPAAAPAAPAVVAPSAPEAAPSTEGPKILVKGFRIKGATLIPEAELQAPLQAVVDKELSLGQLRAAAIALTSHYLQKGYLARVVLPPQDIKDGIVELQVVEAKRGDVSVAQDGKRIDTARAQRFINQRFPQDAPFDFSQLGEALNVLNEQPGVDVKASLAPGKARSEVNLQVKASEEPLAAYNFGLNNYGAYGTGELQGTGSITLNNPTGYFDAASLLINESEGSNYLRADYSLAVGDRGLRLGAYASHLDYRLVPSEFDALDSEGRARVLGLAASYPLKRRTDLNLSLAGGYDHSTLVDETVAGETGDRQVDAFNLGLNGYALSGRLGGGVASFGVDYVFGNSEQRNDAARETDRTSRRVEGSFDKLVYDLGWMSRLPYEVNLNASLHGQFARKNLDSSQQLTLGGPYGVRAYPVGEASGDEGWLFKLDFSKALAETLTGHLFYDAGRITLNRDTWDNWNSANPDRDNRYTLSGVGVGLDWRITPDCLMTASVANPIGSNPGADTNDHDVDGHDNRTRTWLSVNARF